MRFAKPVRIFPLLTALIPFAAFTTLTLHHFYDLGGFWGDSGQIAHVIWHTGPLLRLPALEYHASFFGIHITPILLPFAWLSWLLPLTRIQFFAAFTGLCHALPGVAVYWLLTAGNKLPPGRAAAFGLLFAFNGIALAAARNPHFEMLLVGTGMLFLTALSLRRYRLASLFFILCLATREDAGLHLFLLLATALVIAGCQRRRLAQAGYFAAYAACGLAYSLAVLLLQHLIFPGQGSFANVYLGHPPFAGITAAVLAGRLEFFAVARAYVFLPLYIAAAWALRRRNPHIIGGGIACLPWAAMHLLAAGPIASTMSNYYAFPFIFALFWPLIALRLQPEAAPPAPAFGFTLMLLASFAGIGLQHNPGSIALPQSFWRLPSLARQRATDAALQSLAGNRALGRVVVDGSVAALDQDDYAQSQLLGAPQQGLPNTIIFFAQGYQHKLATTLAAKADLTYISNIPNTALMLATKPDRHSAPGPN